MAEFKKRPKELIDLTISVYNETNSAYKTASKVGLTPYVVYSILKENNINIPNWTDEKPSKWKVTGEKAKELVLDYKNGVPNKELCEKYGVGREAIKNTIKREGIILRDHGGQRRRVSKKEAEIIVSLRKNGIPQVAIATQLKCATTVVSRILINSGLFEKGKAKGENHGSWKGGIAKKGDGYLLQKVYFNNPYFKMATRAGYIPQHRYVMAKHLGRILDKNETVHHIDGNRENNMIENLQLRQGRHGNGVVMICNCCGSKNIKTINL